MISSTSSFALHLLGSTTFPIYKEHEQNKKSWSHHSSHKPINRYPTALIVRCIIVGKVTRLEDLCRCVAGSNRRCCGTIGDPTCATPPEVLNLSVSHVADQARGRC